MTALAWILRRARLRHEWRQRRINFGQFCAGLDGAPRWLHRSTETVAHRFFTMSGMRVRRTIRRLRHGL